MAKATKKSEKKVPNTEPEPESEPDNLTLHPPEMESKFTPEENDELFSDEPAAELEQGFESPETPEQPPVPPPSSIGSTPPRPKGRPRTRPEAILHPEIMDRLNNLETWEGIRVYVYRKEPISNRLLGPNTFTNCARYEGSFDEQDLMNELGSGVYQLRVTKVNPVNAKRTMFDSGDVRIMNMKYPPKVPKGEWLDDPRNKAWEWARNIENAKPEDKPAPTAPDPTITMLEILKQQLQTSQEESRSMRNLILSKKPEDTTSPILAMLTPLMPALLEKLMAPPPPPPKNPLDELITKFMMKQLDAAPVAPPPPVDPIAQLEKTQDFLERMEARSGGGKSSRSRKTGWQEVLTEIGGPLAQMLTPFAQAIATGMQQPKPQQPGGPPQQQPQPGQQLVPVGQIEAPQAQTPQTDLWQSRTPPQPPGPRIVKQGPTLEDFATAVADHLKYKHDGFDLGDWYINTYGEDEFEEARGQGNLKLMADLQSLPNHWPLIVRYSETGELNRIITEFIEWEPDQPEEEDDEQDEDPLDIKDRRTAEILKADREAAAAIQDGWNAPPIDLKEKR